MSCCSEPATKENDAMTDNAPAYTDQPTTPPPDGKKKCPDLPKPPKVPEPPEREPCKQRCICPTPPGGPPNDCPEIEELIRSQAKVVTQAERAKAFVEELKAFQGKVASAQVDYTQARYKELNKFWKDQDKLIADLTEKIKCTVPCWECLLECRLCRLLEDIRTLEDRLNGTGGITDKVFSLIDLQFWHQRNVAQLQARVDRISGVLAVWEKLSATLGDALDKNGKLVLDLPAVLAADPAKAVYDIFMTLLPRHWAIRPRGATSGIKDEFIKVCTCDDGEPDVCCGPDVGVRSLRDRLVGTLPYIVDPADFRDLVCCLITERLGPASVLLATAQANLAATSTEIEEAKKLIADKTAAIETSFKAELGNPIDCSDYPPAPPPPPPPPPPPSPQDAGYQGETKPTGQTAR
jgi:hypothetical protein